MTPVVGSEHVRLDADYLGPAFRSKWGKREYEPAAGYHKYLDTLYYREYRKVAENYIFGDWYEYDGKGWKYSKFPEEVSGDYYLDGEYRQDWNVPPFPDNSHPEAGYYRYGDTTFYRAEESSWYAFEKDKWTKYVFPISDADGYRLACADYYRGADFDVAWGGSAYSADGYYRYNDTTYYVQSNTWYEYSGNKWRESTYPTGDSTGYYSGYSVQEEWSVPSWKNPVTPRPWRTAAPQKNDRTYDRWNNRDTTWDDDWDSGWDSWDSSDTDWDSDW